MSEFINNRAYRQQRLKELIRQLHDGATVDEVKDAFHRLTEGISAIEITEMEQALVNEGMPVEEIQRLCDVHASVFKGSIQEIHSQDGFELADFDEGHPIHTFKKENRVIEALLEQEVLRFLSDYTEYPVSERLGRLQTSLEKLLTIDKHYKRKEHLIFPYMEKYNITAPPQVMWGVDDEIRADIKAVLALTREESPQIPLINAKVREMVTRVNEMIFKEEEIMFPMVLETFTQQEWIEIEQGSAEIGFTLLHAVKRWMPAAKASSGAGTRAEKSEEPEVGVKSYGQPEQMGAGGYGQAAQFEDGSYSQAAQAAAGNGQPTQVTAAQPRSMVPPVAEDAPDVVINRIQRDSGTIIPFDAGSLSAQEVNAILNTIPFDMTYVGADNRVKYFTQGKERIFDRPLTIIGREVKNCHPPKSVHVVEKIVADLKSGKKDHEDFWIRMGGQFVYIRYFAVRSKEGEFLGTLEITQNIKPITELEGEKRLMEE